ncbi:ALF repeat-containing protein [Streptomyces sp. NPDC029004]|uniref:ALF repeat-containing protein n=1 Tax=Streptomyces sp. NPDC029004 TaxID=3154490 RepID=UPI0033EB64A7
MSRVRSCCAPLGPRNAFHGPAIETRLTPCRPGPVALFCGVPCADGEGPFWTPFIGVGGAFSAPSRPPRPSSPLPVSFSTPRQPGRTRRPPEADPFLLPDTDRAKVVKAWVLGGKAVRAAAAAALTGSEADVQNFLAVRLASETAVDNRASLLSSLAVVGKGTRREATGALNDGDSAISAFLAGGFKFAHAEDLRVATATVMATSGKAVTKAGNAALTDGSPAALEKFRPPADQALSGGVLRHPEGSAAGMPSALQAGGTGVFSSVPRARPRPCNLGVRRPLWPGAAAMAAHMCPEGCRSGLGESAAPAGAP